MLTNKIPHSALRLPHSKHQTTPPMNLAVRVDEVSKHYVLKSETIRALRSVSFDVPAGDYVISWRKSVKSSNAS